MSDTEENTLQENDSERVCSETSQHYIKNGFSPYIMFFIFNVSNFQLAIRNELSSLSFEDLQKLKERVGSKLYKEVVFGKKNNPEAGPKVKIFKRENKNRPREMSSKRPVRMLGDMGKVKKTEVRDPRYSCIFKKIKDKILNYFLIGFTRTYICTKFNKNCNQNPMCFLRLAYIYVKFHLDPKSRL